MPYETNRPDVTLTGGSTTVDQGTSPWVVGDGGGSLTIDAVDGGLTSVGATTDAEATGNGSVIAILKRIRTLLGGALSVTVSGTPTVNQGTSPWVVGDGGGSLSIDDNGGSLSIDDGGGSLTVDGSVAITGTPTVNQGTSPWVVDQQNTADLDYDTGAGTVNQAVVGLALPGSGGPVAGGTAANPVRVDPTGTTAQPVTDGGGSLTVDGTVTVSSVGGTVAVTQSTSPWVVSAADGGLASVGATADAAASSDAGTFSLIALIKRLLQKFTTQFPAALTGSGNFKVSLAETTVAQPVTDNGGSLTVDGTVAVSSVGGTVTVGDGGGVLSTDSADGAHVTLGATTDAESASGNGTVVALLKRLRTLLAGGLPAALTGSGNLKAAIVEAIVAGDNLIGRVKVSDGTTVATVRELGANDALNVAITDGSGNQVTSFGGGTQYTEGDVDTTITGTAMMWEDAGDTLRPVSATKPLPVGDGGGSLTIDGSVSISGSPTVNQGTSPWVVGGNKSSNGGAPGATNLGVLPAVATAAAPSYTEGNQVALSVNLAGQLRALVSTTPQTAGTATLTNVSASASSVTVLAANGSRLGAIIYNDSPARVFLKMGSTASSTSFTERLDSQESWEVPFNYTGIITGIWIAATGSARVTELTA